MKKSKKAASIISKSFEKKAIKLDKIKGGNSELVVVIDDDIT